MAVKGEAVPVPWGCRRASDLLWQTPLHPQCPAGDSLPQVCWKLVALPLGSPAAASFPLVAPRQRWSCQALAPPASLMTAPSRRPRPVRSLEGPGFLGKRESWPLPGLPAKMMSISRVDLS